MPFDEKLANRIRKALADLPKVEEKRMFGGLAFLVNGKMCVNVSGVELMCRFDPKQQSVIETRPGFRPMIMNRRKYKGYCYVDPEYLGSKKELDFWLQLALDYNPAAKKSKK